LAKKIALFALRVALVVAPIAWIYARADTGSIAATLASVSVPAIVCVAALTVANMLLQGVKWWVLIRRFVPDIRLGRAVSAHIESVFYSIVLPSAVAQDVVKSVMLSKSHDPSAVWAASWLSRLIGLFSLLAYSIVGAIFLGGDALPSWLRAPLLVAAGAIALLCALSFSKRFTRPLGVAAEKIVGRKALVAAKKLRDGIYAFKRERATLALTLAVSAVVQFLSLLGVSIAVYAVSGRYFLAECLVFVPLVEIVAVSQPLSPGGVGVREALMALLFSRLGFSEAQTASYVTISLMMSMTRLVGLVPVIIKKFGKPPAGG
jgi:uncharacterized membrane protein YbhN (UPF0104 family)